MVSSSPLQDDEDRQVEDPSRRGEELVTTWLRHYLGDLLEMDAQSVDVDMPFDRYGLDSSAAVGMTGDLSNWLGAPVDETMTYDHPTIRQLAAALLAETPTQAAVHSKLAAS